MCCVDARIQALGNAGQRVSRYGGVNVILAVEGNRPNLSDANGFIGHGTIQKGYRGNRAVVVRIAAQSERSGLESFLEWNLILRKFARRRTLPVGRYRLERYGERFATGD